MNDDKPNPYSQNSQSKEPLAIRMDTLASLPPAIAANQLNQVLRELKNCRIEPKLIYPLLINLTPFCLSISDSLSGLTLSESNHKLKKKSIQIARLGMHLLRQMASLFCRLAESKQLDAVQTQLTHYYALQFIGYYLRCCSLLYEIPPVSLWKKSADLYRTAVANDILYKPLSPSLPQFKSQTNIAGVLKRNLLFSISEPNSYSAPEISQLFHLCNQHFELLDFSTAQAERFNFYWDLEGDAPSSVIGDNKYLPKGFMAIDSSRIGLELEHGSLETGLKPANQAKLTLHLTEYRHLFKSISLDPPSAYQLLIGLPDICKFLQEMEKLAKIESLSLQEIDGKNMPPKRDQEYSYFKPLPRQIRVPEKKINLLRTDGKSFLIAEKCYMECSIGDLVLFYKDRQSPMLGIIRQKNKKNLSDSALVLLECIPGNYSVYPIATDNGEATALIVNETGNNPEAFLPGGTYKTEQQFTLKEGKSMSLRACREYNSFICRFRISLEKSEQGADKTESVT